MRVAVIGAGASGLVTLKCLLRADHEFSTWPIEVWLFEKEAAIGGTFRYRTYEEGELVSSRFLTSFSDFRIPDSSPDFISTEAYCTYLQNYCTQFGLWSRMKLNTTVYSVQRSEKGEHVITFAKNDSTFKEQWSCDAIAVCTGLNVTPNIPIVHGLEYAPKAFHSSVFKERQQFGVNKNILILGAGETAMDLGYLAITAPTQSVTICHRGGWKNEPKRLPDPIYFRNRKGWTEDIERRGVAPPTDTGYASLFDTAYLHPALERGNMVWDYYDKFTWFYSWLTTGVGTGIDQYAGDIRGSRHHSRQSLAMKSNRTQAYISNPYRPKITPWIEKIRLMVCDLPVPDTQGLHINLAPWPDHIDSDGVVHFEDNGREEYQMMKRIPCKPDIIVYATGYTQVFPFFDQSYPTVFDADIRRVWKTGVEDVGFIGFVRPSFGAIPPLAELQAQLWITNLFSRLPRPIQPKENYLLKADSERRLDYVVDHETYAYCLACDMGAAPTFLQVASFGPKVFGTWALGPNFNTKFRLVGPWKWNGASDVMKGEQWRVIRRRKGIITWACMSFIPLSFFGVLSLVYYIGYSVKDLILSPLSFLGLKQSGANVPRHERGRDPLGLKRARAEKDANGPQKVQRG